MEGKMSASKAVSQVGDLSSERWNAPCVCVCVRARQESVCVSRELKDFTYMRIEP